MARRRRRRGAGPVSRRVAALVPLALAAALTMSACSSSKTGPGVPPVASSTSPVSDPSASSTPPVSDTDESPQAAPTPARTSEADAIDVADKLMTAYARPTLSATEWMNGVTPYLSQNGASAYQGTDPSQIPVTKVTGKGAVQAAATTYALNVAVPTNKGTYIVALTRPDASSPWLADRILVPGE
jgi:hypothetical protein